MGCLNGSDWGKGRNSTSYDVNSWTSCSHLTLGEQWILIRLQKNPWSLNQATTTNLSHTWSRDLKNNKNLSTMHFSPVSATCSHHSYMIPTSHPYRNTTTFQQRCLHQGLEDGCVQPVSADGIWSHGGLQIMNNSSIHNGKRLAKWQ